MGIGDWGLGFWGLGFGGAAPNPKNKHKNPKTQKYFNKLINKN